MIKSIVYNCHEGIISYHKSLFNQEKGSFEFRISSIEHTWKHRTLWLLLSSYETHLSRFIRWSEFVGMQTPIKWEFPLSLWRGFCSTSVSRYWLSIANERPVLPGSSKLLWFLQNCPITSGSFIPCSLATSNTAEKWVQSSMGSSYFWLRPKSKLYFKKYHSPLLC